jgi:hypothetical protein
MREACRRHGSSTRKCVDERRDHRDAANRVTSIRSIPDRFRSPKAGIRCFLKKNFSNRDATQDLTSQAPKLRARIEMLRAKRNDFVFSRVQVILILSRQMPCHVLYVQTGATLFATAPR